MKFIVVYVTAKDLLEGRKITQYLLERNLAACVNIIPNLESHYRWQGKVECSAEVLLIIKTRQSFFSKLVKAVKEVHSYDVPEIIALPMISGEKNYFAWLVAETK